MKRCWRLRPLFRCTLAHRRIILTTNGGFRRANRTRVRSCQHRRTGRAGPRRPLVYCLVMNAAPTSTAARLSNAPQSRSSSKVLGYLKKKTSLAGRSRGGLLTTVNCRGLRILGTVRKPYSTRDLSSTHSSARYPNSHLAKLGVMPKHTSNCLAQRRVESRGVQVTADCA